MTADLVHLTVDGRGIDVPRDTLLWEAAHHNDIDIPIFCYHSKLGPVGVCRMCMVEIEGQPKLTTACTTPVAEGMVVHTKSPDVEKAQRGILEFLLINHPLDCPICDRAGECPLQDQTYQYGPGVSRFIERKRHFLKPIPLGPTIDLDRERCILCWRCVRYTSEIVEDDQLILADRGSETYIATYEDRAYESNFSGNVIELCPVGALTSHKQRFGFRPWELKEHPSVCPHCAMGCNIQIDVRDAQEVIRFRTRNNDAVDDGWLCDRGRFGYDFIGSPERLTTPLIRKDGRLVPASWTAAYRVIAENLQQISAEHGAASVAGIVSPTLPNEDLFAFKRFMEVTAKSPSVDYSPRPSVVLDAIAHAAWKRLNERLVSISAVDDARLIIVAGVDPGVRQPVMELRIRKAINKRGATLVEIGTGDIALTSKAEAAVRCPGDQFGGMLRALTMTGELPDVTREFDTARQLLLGTGAVVLLYDDYFPNVPADHHGEALLALDALVSSLSSSREVGVISLLGSANEMAARDFGLMATTDGGAWEEPLTERLAGGEFAAAILAGVDHPPASALRAKLAFLAVCALTLTETASAADVVLPIASFAERVGTVTNTARQVQVITAAVPAPGIARPLWQIMVELSQRWDDPLTYSSSAQVLADIGRTVPAYAPLLPSSYVISKSPVLPAGAGMAAE